MRFAPLFGEILDPPLNMFLIVVIVHKSPRVNNTWLFFRSGVRYTRAINLVNKALSTKQLVFYFLVGIFSLIFILNFIQSVLLLDGTFGLIYLLQILSTL